MRKKYQGDKKVSIHYIIQLDNIIPLDIQHNWHMQTCKSCPLFIIMVPQLFPIFLIFIQYISNVLNDTLTIKMEQSIFDKVSNFNQNDNMRWTAENTKDNFNVKIHFSFFSWNKANNSNRRLHTSKFIKSWYWKSTTLGVWKLRNWPLSLSYKECSIFKRKIT